MTFVWIKASAGVSRYVDDHNLPVCNFCGQRVSVCRDTDCTNPNTPKPTTKKSPKKNDDLPEHSV